MFFFFTVFELMSWWAHIKYFDIWSSILFADAIGHVDKKNHIKETKKMGTNKSLRLLQDV